MNYLVHIRCFCCSFVLNNSLCYRCGSISFKPNFPLLFMWVKYLINTLIYNFNDPPTKSHCQMHFIYLFIIWTSGNAVAIFWKKMCLNIHEVGRTWPFRISQDGASIIYYQSSMLHIRWKIGDRLHY